MSHHMHREKGMPQQTIRHLVPTGSSGLAVGIEPSVHQTYGDYQSMMIPFDREGDLSECTRMRDRKD
jgi:hypothetical protein